MQKLSVKESLKSRKDWRKKRKGRDYVLKQSRQNRKVKKKKKRKGSSGRLSNFNFKRSYKRKDFVQQLRRLNELD